MIPHGNAAGMSRPDAVRSPLPMADDGRPVVAVLGAIGPDKGARRLERLVELTRERGLPLRWVLIGYLDRGREPFQIRRRRVHDARRIRFARVARA